MKIVDKKFYTPSGIIITTKEPSNKDLLWIHPYTDYIEVKLFNKGWKILFTSKDKGLSEQSKELTELLITNKTTMLSNRINNNSITFIRQIDDLKRRVKELEDKINT